MSFEGKGVAQDFQQAASWVRKAAEQGVADAQFDLGQAYLEGEGVAKDMAEAVKWWIRNVVIQISSKQLGSYEPFLYLACIAPEFGHLGWVERLERHADKIQQVRFDVSLHKRVHARFQELKANLQCIVSIRKAMELLDREFLST